MSSLAVEGLCKSYEGGVSALRDVSLSAADGELLAVVGPSGSGKSTLLRLIAGLETPDSGRVLVGGEDVTAVPASRRGVAMVFQSFALFGHLSIARNIAFGLDARGVPAAERDARVAGVAERLDISKLLDRRPAQLSGGERQRVALARGLVGRPKALLLDEPLSNLDARLRSSARAELRRLQEAEGLTMVHVTHDQAEALRLGRRVAVLDAGRLAQAGTPDEVYDQPADVFVARFVGSPAMNLVPAGALPVGGGRDGVLIGFRPEHVQVGDGPGAFDAAVELVERAGHDVVWRLRAGETEFAARPPAGARAGEGERVRVRVEAGDLRFFDARTGRAL